MDDYEVGFVISHAYDIEEVGWKGIVKRIRDTVGDNPVYSASSLETSLRCGTGNLKLMGIE